MSTAPVSQGPLYESPENMAETLRLAYDAQKATETLKDRAKEADEGEVGSIRYIITPQSGELSARLWEPDGRNWLLRSGDERVVNQATPFVATSWEFDRDGHNGMRFKFYNNHRPKGEKDEALMPYWELTVDVKGLDNLRVIEEVDGEAASEWLGRHAVLGAQG